MPTNTPPFKEKEFLLGLLASASALHGEELRFVMAHKFESINVGIAGNMPTLAALAGDIAIKKFISEWFREAEQRGLVTFVKPHHYRFTEAGYNAALSAKRPIMNFVKNNPTFTITASIAFGGVLVTLITSLSK